MLWVSCATVRAAWNRLGHNRSNRRLISRSLVRADSSPRLVNRCISSCGVSFMPIFTTVSLHRLIVTDASQSWHLFYFFLCTVNHSCFRECMVWVSIGHQKSRKLPYRWCWLNRECPLNNDMQTLDLLNHLTLNNILISIIFITTRTSNFLFPVVHRIWLLSLSQEQGKRLPLFWLCSAMSIPTTNTPRWVSTFFTVL